MGIYTIVEAREQFSKVIEEVRAGILATITAQGEAVATITPVAPAQPAKREVTSIDYDEIARRRRARTHTGADSVTAIREMRDEVT